MKRYARFIWTSYEDDPRGGWDDLDGLSDNLDAVLAMGITTGNYGHIADLETGKVLYRLEHQQRQIKHPRPPELSMGSAPPYSLLGYSYETYVEWKRVDDE